MNSVKREIQVARIAFGKQPLWQKIGKYAFLIALLTICWNTKYFWWAVAGSLLLGFGFHFWLRYKTKGWTKDYWLFKHEDYRRN